MKYNVFTYLVGEGFSNVFKNKKQAFTSFGTMCLIMIFFGICFIIVGNFNSFIKQVEAQQGIQAFIKKDATEEEIEQVKNDINEIEEINTIEFVSQEQALQSVKERVFKERADLLEGYNVSIFKTSYKITLTDITKTAEVKEKLLNIENVVKVTNTDEVIEVLKESDINNVDIFEKWVNRYLSNTQEETEENEEPNFLLLQGDIRPNTRIIQKKKWRI